MIIKKILPTILLMAFFYTGNTQQPALDKSAFAILNLDYPGLEQVKADVQAQHYDAAATALLAYYKKKSNKREPDFSAAEEDVDLNRSIDKATRAAADSALLHKFQPHKGYGFFITVRTLTGNTGR